MNLGDAYQNNVLDYLYGGSPPTPPGTVYVALYTVAPTSAGGGTEVSTSGTAYARVAVPNDGTNFTNPATGGSKVTALAQTFPTATADWGTIVAYAFHDDPTADSIVTWQDLASSAFVASGETPQFNAGVLETTAS